jgi:hypothetical protein
LPALRVKSANFETCDGLRVIFFFDGTLVIAFFDGSLRNDSGFSAPERVSEW